jgi:hypothetical protein
MKDKENLAPRELLEQLLREENLTGNVQTQLPHVYNNEFWKEFHILLRTEALEPFVFRILERSTVSPGVPEELFRNMGGAAIRNSLVNRLRFESYVQIASALYDKNIRFLPVKGLALIQTIYANHGDRCFNDLDILIDQSNIEEAKTILISLGFRMDPFRSVWGKLPAFYLNHHLPPFRRESTVVELHYKLLPGKSEVFSQRFLEAGAHDPDCPSLPLPDPAFHAAFLAAHWYKHAQSSQNQTRLIRDLALILENDALKWDAGRAIATEFDLMTAWKHARIEFERIYLGNPTDAIVVSEHPRKVLTHFFRPFKILPTYKARLYWILDLSFPSKQYIGHQYPHWKNKSQCLWHIHRVRRVLWRLIRKKAVARLQ